MNKLHKLTKALGRIIRHPYLLNLVLQDEGSNKKDVIREYGLADGLPVIEINELFPDFDEIAKGEKVWNAAISEFYTPFHKQVESVLAVREYSHVERESGTDPATGDKLIAKFGQYGPYVQKGEGEKKIVL